MTGLSFQTREAAFDFLDSYASNRKTEIDDKRLSKDSGLIKSYGLETAAGIADIPATHSSIENQFEAIGWRVKQVDANGFYQISSRNGFVGFADYVSERHLIIHTMTEANKIDRLMRNLVKDSAQLDFVWLAGNFLNLIWETFIRPYMPHRFVTFKFEHLGRFEENGWGGEEIEDDYSTKDDEDTETLEHRASTLKVTHRVSKVAEFLPRLQAILPDFKAIKMLRIPATDLPGGYEFWDWGKVTYRSPSFRDGRNYLRQIIALYQETTELIEEQVWFQIERTRVGHEIDSMSITGTPITFQFSPQLEHSTFHNFVETTFERGQGPLRLWGNPIYLAENKVHVHAIDLHLWKRVYLELTPARFLVILPRGTCGNTVHRLISNIQRFLSPEVKVYIGDAPYEKLVKNVLLNRV